MTRIVNHLLSMAAVFALAATAAQAQTTCTDPVAHIVSPTPGSTPAPALTTTTVGNPSVTFSSSAQSVALTAAVAAASTVNQGSVTFQVMDGATNAGTAVLSPTLTNGGASAIYALPAATASKVYSIQATYSGGTNFLASSGNGRLTINKAQSTTTFTSTPPARLTLNEMYAPTATSTGDGTLTIEASGSCSIANGVVTITATSGTCTVTATESEGPNFLGSSATPQTIPIQPDFSLSTSTPSVTISAPGGSGTTTLTIAGQPGYGDTISFTPASCSGLPAKSRCSFNPASVTGSGSTTITVTTTAPQSATLTGVPDLYGMPTGGVIMVAGVFLAGIPGKRRRRSKILGLLAVAFLLAGVGCGGGGSGRTTVPGTPAGTFTVTVTGTSGTLTHSTTFTLTVQ
jgi:hypothetical protein